MRTPTITANPLPPSHLFTLVMRVCSIPVSAAKSDSPLAPRVPGPSEEGPGNGGALRLADVSRDGPGDVAWAFDGNPVRSEEHTAELQSPCNIVCRLRLGKKT